MLIREITITPIEAPTRSTRVQVLWQTGAVSELLLGRPDRYSARATSPQALTFIRRSVGSKSDDQIAAELNRRRIKTGAGLAWTMQAVRRMRYEEGLYRPSPRARRAPEFSQDGLWSVHAVAARVGAPIGVVRLWMRTGVLEPVRRGGPGRPAWFNIDDATLERLRRVRSEMLARRSPSSQTG
jgi:hypothetical protein